MTGAVRWGVVLLSIAGLSAACASSEQWKEWRSHSSHFASGDHAMFSLRNQGKTPKVYAGDAGKSSTQSWWGDPVVVRADQIFKE
jgi:hypothetical protein